MHNVDVLYRNIFIYIYTIWIRLNSSICAMRIKGNERMWAVGACSDDVHDMESSREFYSQNVTVYVILASVGMVIIITIR